MSVYLGEDVKLDLNNSEWINKPSAQLITSDSVVITTEPETDFWQRSYYGFRNDNAPALLFDSSDNWRATRRISTACKL